MGPYYLTMLVHLLGPARRIMAMGAVASPERLITAEGPLQGTRFTVGTPTTVKAIVEFASGALVTIGMSWDVFRHSIPPIELHGTEGSLRLPDPDTFGGPVAVSRQGAVWSEHATIDAVHGAHNWPFAAPDRANYRMLGVADLARSLAEGRPARASGALALHVLDIMEAVLTAADSGVAQTIEPTELQVPALSELDAAALMAPAA